MPVVGGAVELALEAVTTPTVTLLQIEIRLAAPLETLLPPAFHFKPGVPPSSTVKKQPAGKGLLLESTSLSMGLALTSPSSRAVAARSHSC